MRILTMSGPEIRRWAKSQTPVLWGSATRRQFGSPQDLLLARIERERYHLMLRNLEAFGKIARATTKGAIQLSEAMTRIARAFKDAERARSLS